MRFDAYHATIPADFEDVAGEFSRMFYLADLRPVGGRTFGYERIVGWYEGDEERLRMHYGGNGGGAHVRVQGAASPDVAKRVRIIWPNHSVSRADVCEDYQWVGAWREITSEALRIAQDACLRVTEVKGHGRGDTLYVGARSSTAMLRVYQKDVQINGSRGDPDYVRVELEVKPQKGAAKQLAAALEPREFWGVGWTREFCEWLFGDPASKVVLGTVRSPSDWERTQAWLAKQAYEALSIWANKAGGAEKMMQEMFDLRERLTSKAEADRTN